MITIEVQENEHHHDGLRINRDFFIVNLILYNSLVLTRCRINGVVVTWVVAIDPPGVRVPLNAENIF